MKYLALSLMLFTSTAQAHDVIAQGDVGLFATKRLCFDYPACTSFMNEILGMTLDVNANGALVLRLQPGQANHYLRAQALFDANGTGYWEVQRDDVLPVANDPIGSFRLAARDTLGAYRAYGEMFGAIADPASGAPSGDMSLRVLAAGSLDDFVKLRGGLGEVEVTSDAYLRIAKSSAGAPPAADCDSDAEAGRMTTDTTNNRLYVCRGAARGWDYAALTD